jgi:hypothetical protein
MRRNANLNSYTRNISQPQNTRVSSQNNGKLLQILQEMTSQEVSDSILSDESIRIIWELIPKLFDNLFKFDQKNAVYGWLILIFFID